MECTIKKSYTSVLNALENLPGARRPKSWTKTEKIALLREVKVNLASSAVKLAENVATTFGKPGSGSNVR